MRVIAVLIVLSTSVQAQDAKDSLNQGVQAFKQAHYPEAVAAFQKAVSRDPSDATAHLYLGTAYKAEHDQDTALADQWLRRALEDRFAKAHPQQ